MEKKSKPRFEVEYYRVHRVQFAVSHDAVVYAARQDAPESKILRTLLPAGWSIESDAACGQNSWIEFGNDEPFKDEELAEMCRKLQLLCDAFAAMVKDTEAEKK